VYCILSRYLLPTFLPVNLTVWNRFRNFRISKAIIGASLKFYLSRECRIVICELLNFSGHLKNLAKNGSVSIG